MCVYVSASAGIRDLLLESRTLCKEAGNHFISLFWECRERGMYQLRKEISHLLFQVKMRNLRLNYSKDTPFVKLENADYELTQHFIYK